MSRLPCSPILADGGVNVTRRIPTERELRLKVRETVFNELSYHQTDESLDACFRWIYRDYPALLVYARALVEALETGKPIDNLAARSV